MENLIPYYQRLRNEYDLPVPIIPMFNYAPCSYPEKNECDVEIARINDNTNIELAKIYERVNRENNKLQRIQCGKETLIASIYSNPGKSNWNMDILDEEKGLFRRQPKLFSIHIR